MSEQTHERLQVHASVAGPGEAHVSTGLPVLDHLLTLMSHHGSLGLNLEVAPGSPGAEVVAAAQALGNVLAERLREEGVRGHGSCVVPADEALAHVALEASGRPLFVANVDLSDAKVGGLDNDLVSVFLREFAESAGLTLHVRLIEGADPQHVLEAIFKALGVALAQAARPRVRKEEQ
jgi:imidazoleglycerol-phosphate dehydratase